MTANKHTPGPWFASGRYIGTFNHKSAIGECRSASGCWSDDEPASANARLIAAAPDNYSSNIELAGIVRELCAAYGHPLPQASLDRSDAAIAKAGGAA